MRHNFFTYDTWAIREDFNDVLQKYYQRKYGRVLRGMNISFAKRMRRLNPNQKFKTEVKIQFIIKKT